MIETIQGLCSRESLPKDIFEEGLGGVCKHRGCYECILEYCTHTKEQTLIRVINIE